MNRGSAASATTTTKANSLSSFMATPSPSSFSPSLFSPSPILEHEERSYHNNHHHQQQEKENYHQPTPLHPSSAKKNRTPKQTPTSAAAGSESTPPVAVVSYSKCRPSSRDSKKPSVVPISPTSTSAAARRITPPSPLSLLNSLFHRRASSVSLSSTTTPQSTLNSSSSDDPHSWRATATDLSKKLIAATRKRDEALLETSKLKYSLSELELKLARLESSYRDLAQSDRTETLGSVGTQPIEPSPFVRSVSDSRAASRTLARALSSHLRKNPVHGPSSLLPAHMEAFLNRVFFSGFELDIEEEIKTADPVQRCELNRTAYRLIKDLTWDEVLTKGTKHFSEGLSRFCDTKMSDVVGSIGWTKSWPEPLLQAFFQAAKAAWSVRLLARSVYPSVPIIRVDRGARFDARFMEDSASDRAGTDRLEPVSVKMLVSPGFYLYDGKAGETVVKCKVLCLYSSRRDGYRDASVGDGVGRCQLRDQV